MTVLCFSVRLSRSCSLLVKGTTYYFYTGCKRRNGFTISGKPEQVMLLACIVYFFYRVYIYEWVLTSVNRSCSLLVNFDLRSSLTRWVRFWCFILFLQLSPMPLVLSSPFPVVCFSEGQVSFLCHLNVCSFVDWLGRLCRLAGVGLRWCELGGEIDK